MYNSRLGPVTQLNNSCWSNLLLLTDLLAKPVSKNIKQKEDREGAQ